MAKEKSVALRVTPEEHAIIVAEANGPNFDGVLSNYIRKIWESREDMVIDVDPDFERLQHAHDREIRKLEDQIEKLQDRLSAADRSTGLAGVNAKEQDVHQLIQEAVQRTKDEIAQATLRERYDVLVKQHEALIGEHKRLEKENQELANGQQSDAKMAGYLDMGSKALGTLLESSPTAKSRFEQGGFAGLAGIGGGGNTISLNSPEMEQDLKLGQVIRKEFPGDKYGQLIDVIRYMRQNAGVLGSIVQSQRFQAFMQAA